MKTFQTSEEPNRLAANESLQSEFEFRPLPDPSRAARLSLIPGLGQFYNGQKRKGALFLATTIASCLLFVALICGPLVLKLIVPLAALFNLRPNEAAAASMAVSSSVVAISVLLYVSFVAYAVRDAYDHAAFMRKRSTGPRFMIGLAETTSGSYLAHFAIIACFLIAILFLIAPKPPSQQITDIELMPEAHKAPRNDKPKNNPAPKAEPKPEPPKQVTPPPKPVITPPKPVVAPPVKAPPVVAPIAVKSDTPSANTVPVAPSAPAASQSSGQTNGSAGTGQSGDASGDDQDIDFGPYLAAMQRRIKKAWFPPKGNESKRVTLKFDIQRDGSVTNVRMVASSGVSIVDDAAIQAVQNAAPFAPLPKGSPDELDIKFTFDYNVFNGTTRGAFHQF